MLARDKLYLQIQKCVLRFMEIYIKDWGYVSVVLDGYPWNVSNPENEITGCISHDQSKHII